MIKPGINKKQTMTNNPTEILESEHHVIARVIGGIAVLSDRLEAGQKLDLDTLHGVVEFMRTFADRCHHGKEEELLFPLLAERGVPLHGCPVGALIAEHHRGRILVTELDRAVDLYLVGDAGGKEALIKGLGSLAAVYPNHIWKEDYLLFPMTNKVLRPVDQKQLCEGFTEVEDRIGSDTHHRLEEFAARLAQDTQAG